MEQYESPFGVIHKSRESRKASELRRKKLQERKAQMAARSQTVHEHSGTPSPSVARSDRARMNSNARGYAQQQADVASGNIGGRKYWAGDVPAFTNSGGGGKGKYVAGGVAAAGLGAAGAAKLIASRMGQSKKGLSTAQKLGIGAAGAGAGAGAGGYAYSRRKRG